MPQDTQESRLTAVTDATLAATVLAADRPVVVDFWAEWCPPCRVVSKHLAGLAEEFGDRLSFVTLNTDENPATTRAYQVMSAPTMLVFRDGQVVGSIVGSRPRDQLRLSFARHLDG
ncbi:MULTISPECIES: co-chaperone YbbN [Micromonospora]|uniref:Thioredoxin n=1 Tax=Micromonospora solifontis TaxID=2487138 RepID=A0ABX9WKI5_9ACTN|nr:MULTISPECIES: thioredoxin domain-containing protein [Micromonospora]NES14837.1 redoxin domain-containing protein [Micromonospora sp. PPF5-17B]NES35401.1 redoxin domain-containing protein [Micromonospora solifontis]NES56117.1 redoxin domain-containing protein [Micromonospora sp. PPF5-6]RNM00889.1 thiol reductase thioredoxin [Micromonospora solifontis]